MDKQRIQEANLLIEATHFATRYHNGQVRKGNKLPYITHPLTVGILIKKLGQGTNHMVVVGILHDVLEDTSATYDQLVSIFGKAIADDVQALTDVSKAFGNRKMRVLENRRRILASSPQVQVVKVADMAHNLSDVANMGSFATKYIHEKLPLINNLNPVAPDLYDFIKQSLIDQDFTGLGWIR